MQDWTAGERALVFLSTPCCGNLAIVGSVVALVSGIRFNRTLTCIHCLVAAKSEASVRVFHPQWGFGSVQLYRIIRPRNAPPKNRARVRDRPIRVIEGANHG